MDWPSEVLPAAPFVVRLVVFQPCGADDFRPGATADQSAVTYAPRFRMDRGDFCALDVPTTVEVIGSLDTTDLFRGLPANLPRTYEMRAVASVQSWSVALDASDPIRTFGEITVRSIDMPPPGTTPPVRNAGGFATVSPDGAGCARIRPSGAYRPEAVMALADSPDTTTFWSGFVRGYITPVAACGAPRTFHLVSRD